MGYFIYTMTAEENYPASLTLSLPNYCFCDKQYIGTSYDRVRRNIMYSACVTNQTSEPDWEGEKVVLETNTTGKTLWQDPAGATPNGNVIQLDFEFVFQTAVKNIDSGTVTFHTSYDPTKTVPAGIGAGGITSFTTAAVTGAGTTAKRVGFTGGHGYGAIGEVQRPGGQWVVVLWNIGSGYQVGDVLTYNIGTGDHTITVTGVNTGSDGTWGRKVWDSQLYGRNLLAITNPRNGDFWPRMESCELHYFPASANYAAVISPLAMPFTLAENATAKGGPIGITADWVYFWAVGPSNKLQIVPSLLTAPEIAADKLLATYTYDYPHAGAFDLYYRQIIGPDGNLWVFSSAASGPRDYRLWKCVPGAGFTEMTPWASNTGPNSNVAAWQTDTLDRSYSTRHYVIQLPASNCLAFVTKNFWDAGGVKNPANTRFDCTYYDMNHGTFDYHEQMVFGYMTSDWKVATVDTAAWAVIDVLEFDNDLECSDYVHDVDYTVRRLAFICSPRENGAAIPGYSGYALVFVDYKFVYGHAPQVVQVVTEAGWDSRYTDYAAAIGQTQVVSGSLPVYSAGVDPTASYTAYADQDNGIWDRVTGAMWLSGDQPSFCKFNPVFASRHAAALTGGDITLNAPAASPPFLKLSFVDPAAYCVPFAIGHTYTSQGQILRPVTPAESQTQSGPALGKLRRMTYAAPLLADAQGVSMGVDFMTMRPLDLKSAGGTVPLTKAQLYSGVYWGTVDANENYDNMWCWQITRPYPCTVVAVECQVKTNENL